MAYKKLQWKVSTAWSEPKGTLYVPYEQIRITRFSYVNSDRKEYELSMYAITMKFKKQSTAKKVAELIYNG